LYLTIINLNCRYFTGLEPVLPGSGLEPFRT